MLLYIPIKQECCPQVQKTLPPPHLCCPTSTYLPVSAPIPLVTGSFPAWYSHHILLFSVIGLNSQWSEHLMTCDFPPEDYPLWRHDSHPCCSLLYPWCLALCLIHVGAQKICLEWTNHLTTPFTVEETKIQTGLLAWPLPTGPGAQTQCRWRGRASNPWLGLCICCCTLLPRTSQLPLPHLSPPILRALLCPHWLTLTPESLFKF